MLTLLSGVKLPHPKNLHKPAESKVYNKIRFLINRKEKKTQPTTKLSNALKNNTTLNFSLNHRVGAARISKAPASGGN